MSKMMDFKYEMFNKMERAVLEELLKHLEKITQLDKDGKEEERDLAMEDMKVWVKAMREDAQKKSPLKEDAVINRSELPQEGEVVAIGDTVWLGVIKKDEKDNYLLVSYEYSSLKKSYKDEKFRDEKWNDFLDESSFVCSIYKKETNEYVGYCSVRNLVKGDWELAIELLPDACHKGYGTEALSLFMYEMNRLTGKRFFRTRVEIDNHASQGLMKKLGATPNGVSEFLIHGDEIEKFQEEYKDMITDEIRAVAADFCMEAEDILGYVLEYRFDIEHVQKRSKHDI